ncbi:MAG: TatD family hydrolase [Candidatus Methylomirabilales bacterium]
MVLVDTHCHLDAEEYTDLQPLLEAAMQAGVRTVVGIGSGPASNRRILEIAAAYPEVVLPTAGLHPENLKITGEDLSETLVQIRRERSRLVAIGEVGLPYYELRRHKAPERPLRDAERRLLLFLGLARELDYAVILHAPHERAARALALFQEVGVPRGVFHWHKAPISVTRRILDQGYAISVTPEVCYRDRARELARFVPLDLLLLETDGPEPYEGPFAGERTVPAILPRVVEAVAVIHGVPAAVVAAETTRAASRLFGRALGPPESEAGDPAR